MTINSSTIKTTSPIVTALSSAQGPVTGGTALTVTGTGFVNGSTTVNFVSTTASQNIVIPGVNVNVPAGQSTSLTVTSPAATTVTSYYVVVTTPDGSSLAGPTFTYQPVIPVVNSIVTATNASCGNNIQPPCGSAAGGTTLTINGTGFLSNTADNTTVNFVDTQNSGIVVQAPYIVVNSSTSITATTPITTGSPFTYYVSVTTAPGGASGATGPVFN